MGVNDIQIQLERASGVYYAGEVVRGTVQLKTSGQVRCRGLFVRLQGKARVHWHTGSGDNRTDYDGKTVFQNQRATLVGNFYKTGLIDEAGEDAYFGQQVHNEGVIYIPCEAHEDNNLKLIVRVMDYDWGKRDDLLGEIVLNVGDLAQSKDKLSYPLNRNGKPGKGEVTLSAKFVPYDAIFPGQSNSGQRVSKVARKPLCLVLTVHQATGLRKADWFGKNDVYVQAYRMPEQAIKPGKKLPSPDIKTQLPEGETIFPFAFALQTDAPGSAELVAGDHAFIRYDVYAHVDFARWRDPSRRVIISVIPNRPVPTLKLLAPGYHEELDQLVYKCSCCCFNCCRISGLVSTKLSTDRRSYAPGEVIDIRGSKIVNDSGEQLEVTIVLHQLVRLICPGGFSRDEILNYHLLFGLCPPKSTIDVQSLVTEPIRMPYVFPSFYGGVDTEPTRQRYPCLKWTYFVALHCGPSGACASTAHSQVVILVSVAPPYPNSVDTARSIDCREDIWANDIFSILDEAVTGVEVSDTTPRITGPEDGGHVVAATNFGSGFVPYEAEDAGVIGVNPLYVPHINAFDQSLQPEVSLEPEIKPEAYSEPPSTKPAAYPEPEVLVSAVTLPGSGADNDISSLLNALDDSFDKRRTVGEWIRDHPLAASRFTPAQVEQILKKVTFSLDQTAVAGEIAAGMEVSETLTCAHIVTAIEVCKYQAADVAKAMAPFVKDPQNKQEVLDRIEYSFERDAVERAFKK